MSFDALGTSGRQAVADAIGFDPYEQIELLRDAGARKARAAGIAYQMDHERKAVHARLAGEIEARSKEKLSEAKLDRLARAHPRYAEHLKGTAAAIEEKELAESEYWSIRSTLEWDEKTIAHVNALTRLETR